MAVSRADFGRGLLFEKHTWLRCRFPFPEHKKTPGNQTPLVLSYLGAQGDPLVATHDSLYTSFRMPWLRI